MSLLTVQEMADLLKIGRSKAYELTREKGFPAIRIGNTIRIPQEDLEAWLRRKKEEAI